MALHRKGQGCPQDDFIPSVRFRKDSCTWTHERVRATEVFKGLYSGGDDAHSPSNLQKYIAKASFSAYLLGKHLPKTWEKGHLLTQKSTTNFGRPFCSFPFPFLASKWLKYAVLAFQSAKRVGRENEASAKNVYPHGTIFVVLVSHYSALGDTISCDAPTAR